ncbi:MAG: glycosyltransferase family 4 protein [Chitinophagaceae bacterium]
MKILFVQKMNGISGSELYMIQIMPELKRRGYDIEMLIIYPVYGQNNKRFIEYMAEHGIKTHEIYGHWAMSPILFSRINKILNEGNYDLVQTNLIHADFWLTFVKSVFFKKKLKIVSVKHGYHPSYQAKYGHDLRFLKRDIYYWVARFASRRTDFNITISKGLYSIYVDGEIVNASRIRNIYYGLTLTNPVHSEEVKVPTGDYLLITGRLVGFKGHSFLIQAWKKVKTIYPALKLYFAGEGECRAELEQEVKDAGLQNEIIFLGHTPNPHPLMASSVFTIVSSVWEGFGLILLESWLHKKAIVAFDAPAMNEVIDDGRNGLLATLKDSNALADKIIHLYENPQLAKEYGENGYQKLNSYYTLQRMTDETEQVYQAIYAGQPVPLVG